MVGLTLVQAQEFSMWFLILVALIFLLYLARNG